MRRSSLKRVPAALVTTALLPVVAREFFARDTGREYGVGLPWKLKFLAVTIRNNIRVESASNFLYHLIMAGKILRIPKDLPGDLIECGCFKGGSAVNLSRLAAKTGRRLHLFDSFEGLPAPQEGDKEHLVLSELQFHTYEGGAYAGSLARGARRTSASTAYSASASSTRDTSTRPCPGSTQQLVFAYVDADLTSSVRDCSEVPVAAAAGGQLPVHGRGAPHRDRGPVLRPGLVGEASCTPRRPDLSAAATGSACCCTRAASAAPSASPPSSRRKTYRAGSAEPSASQASAGQRGV